MTSVDEVIIVFVMWLYLTWMYLHHLFPGDEKLSASVTLPLAERMITLMEKDKKIKQEQETRLYLLVLELQVRYF